MAFIPEEILAKILKVLPADGVTDEIDDDERNPWVQDYDSGQYSHSRQYWRAGSSDYWNNARLEHQVKYQKTMAKICLVSRSFCRSAQPLLYATYAASKDDFEREYRQATSDTNRRRQTPNIKIQLFLRTLLERPTLALLVTELHLPTSAWDFAYTYPAPVELTQLYKNNLPTPMLGRLGELREGSHEAETALVLLLCQNARSVSILSTHASEFYWHSLMRLIVDQWDPEHLSSQACSITAHPKVFSKLENLSLDFRAFRSEWRRPSLKILSALTRLPNLKTFRGTLMCLECGTVQPAESHFKEPSLSKLTHVHLHNSSWDATFVKQILQTCANIETVDMHSAPGPFASSQNDHLAVGDVLRMYGKGIKRLIIQPGGVHDLQDVPSWRLGSLKSLEKLRYIKAPLFLLVSESEALSRSSLPSPNAQDYDSWHLEDWKCRSDLRKPCQEQDFLNALYSTLVDFVLPEASVLHIDMWNRGTIQIGEGKAEYRQARRYGLSWELEYR